jgi:hypothetical protein
MPYYIMVTASYENGPPHQPYRSVSPQYLTWPEAVAEFHRRLGYAATERPAATDERDGNSQLIYSVVPA